jgi:hypothetical protein
VVRPVGDATPDVDAHQLIVIDLADSADSPSNDEISLHRDQRCEISESTTMSIRERPNSSISVGIVAIKSCQHQTIVWHTAEEAGLSASEPSQLGVEESLAVLKRILAEGSRSGQYNEVVPKFSRWAMDDLEIHLNEMTRRPYHTALDWRPGKDSKNLLELIRPLLASRATLLDVYAVAKAREVDYTAVESLEVASRRVETALLSLTTWQTAIVEEATRKLAETTARREREEKAHARRIADLGAITLFPMLLFTFLAANLTPKVYFPFEINGYIAFFSALVLGVMIAWLGRTWVRRQQLGGSHEDPK